LAPSTTRSCGVVSTALHDTTSRQLLCKQPPPQNHTHTHARTEGFSIHFSSQLTLDICLSIVFDLHKPVSPAACSQVTLSTQLTKVGHRTDITHNPKPTQASWLGQAHYASKRTAASCTPALPITRGLSIRFSSPCDLGYMLVFVVFGPHRPSAHATQHSRHR
jgi:hypothetical protein